MKGHRADPENCRKEKRRRERGGDKKREKNEREKGLSDYFPTPRFAPFPRLSRNTSSHIASISQTRETKCRLDCGVREDRRRASLVYMLNISRSCPLFSAARIDFIGFRLRRAESDSKCSLFVHVTSHDVHEG